MEITPHPNCERCQLHTQCKTPFMESHGADDPLVLVIGEAPGDTEDRQGIPFIGKSGQLLRDTLEASGFDIDTDVRFTNVVRCRPPDNKIAKRYINYCQHYALEEIEHYQPELVLLMGNSPLGAVLGEYGISQWNGVVIERDEATYVPLYHPAYILRNPAAADDWVVGIDKAVEALTTDVEDTSFKAIYPRTMGELDDMVDFLMGCDTIAYDVESAALDPFADGNHLPCVSFAGQGRTYALDLAPTHTAYNIRLNAINYVLEHHPFIIGQNIKFDQQHTRKCLGVEFKAAGDTMLVSHLLDSRQGIHGLKRLAGLHLGMYDYDKELEEYKAAHPECNPDRGGSYANFPMEILLPYAALDAEATLKLWPILYDGLSQQQKHFLKEVLMPVSNVLADVEYNGNAVDLEIAERYVGIYTYVQDKLLERILQQPEVLSTVRHFQKTADKKIINDIKKRYDGAKTSVCDDCISYTYVNGNTDKCVQRQRKRNIAEFNPNSPVQLRHLYFKEIGVKSDELTDSGELSTSAKVMKTHIDEHPVVDWIIHYKLLTKMLGTYLQPALNGDWAGADGRVRSTYNLHGTRTGRLSSSNPNMQNIPTPEKEADARPNSVVVKLPVKNIFTHTFPGGVLMSVDYSGMELRVFASLADCQPMLEIHKSGADFHSMVSIMAMTGKQPGDISIEDTKTFKKTYPEVRYRYKWTNWTLLYGGDEYTLMNLYGMSEIEAKGTVKSYYDTFPEVLQFRRYCVEFGEDHGYIESPFGRREQLHYINDKFDIGKRNKDRRAAVNMPVQSAASDTLLCALIVIHSKIAQRGLRTMIVNTVHDSIVLDVPPDEIDVVADLCVDVMENITHYAKTYFPNIDFSWLRSPLKADVEIGTHYGVETSYNEWVKNGRPEL